METSDILKRVRQIEIKTRGLSNNIFAGQYHSAFKGKGMSFSEVREYQYGDDVRDIDWNVTARYHKPYVKVFEEERELTVMLLIDVSNSLDFGTVKQMKKDMVTEIAATLAFSAIQNNDKIGVIFFTDRVEKFIPPKKGRKHILYIIRELLNFEPVSSRTDVGAAVEFMTNAIKKRCTVFILSDFFDKGDFTSTKDDKKIRLVRAINGELARLIRQMPNIDNASALVSIPENSMFKADKKPINATVMLTVPSGVRLDNSIVKAIKSLLLGFKLGIIIALLFIFTP